jgi:PAS domain S-box-containing protein
MEGAHLPVSKGADAATPPNDDRPQASQLINSIAAHLSNIGQAVLALGQDDRRFRAIIEALPVALYTTDATGHLTFYNDAAVEIWGRRPALEKDLWCGAGTLYRTDGTLLPSEESPMAVSLRTGHAIQGAEILIERPGGERVPVAAHPTPVFDASGELIGGVNMLVDLTHRQQSHEYAQRLASIVQSSDDAIISKDLRGTIVSWNHGAERLFGYSAEEAIGKPVTMLMPPDRVSEEETILERLRRGERIDHFETIRRRKDGSLVDISLTISPIHGSNGMVVGASKIARDITEVRRAQAQQKLLLAEIMHRVKNTLATVQAIAGQTMRSAPAAEREAFTARLHALSKAHDALMSDKWDRAPLRGLIDAALGPFPSPRFDLEGPETWLNASKSLQMTLALHELATNAVKYGALSNETGRVRLTWELVDTNTLRLRWQESGGPPVLPPKHKGFGSILIEHTFEESCLEYAPQGFICTFETHL